MKQQDTINKLIDIAFSPEMLDCLEYNGDILTSDRRAPEPAGRYLLAGLRKAIMDTVPSIDTYSTFHTMYDKSVHAIALSMLSTIVSVIETETDDISIVPMAIGDTEAITKLRGALLSNLPVSRRVYNIGNMTIRMVGSRAYKLVSRDVYAPEGDMFDADLSFPLRYPANRIMQKEPDAATLYYRLNVCILRLLLVNNG